MISLVFYLAFAGFFTAGLYRWLRYKAKGELQWVMLGVFGILVLSLNDYGSLLFGSRNAIYDLASAFFDGVLAIAVGVLVVRELMRK